MKQRLKDIIEADKTTSDYNTAAFVEFGLSADKHYDILVVAPGWTPTKLMQGFDVEIICTAKHSYISGYEVKGDGFLIAWIQTSPGACSLIDELSMCAVLEFDELIFLGAVGSLTKDIGVGALCTPSFCISGNLANGYLLEDITEYKPFGKVFPNDTEYVLNVMELIGEMGYEIKQAPVFCTDTVLCEYAHMDFIKSFDVSLIEMETSSFYLMADLLEKPSAALLVVSDNSATGESLVLRTKEQKDKYNESRFNAIPQILLQIAKNLHMKQ
ncbi:MAG: hypothetical protein J5840_02935 [Lachnospiraceae bacterium]|nr:hypothetical protein [Lachnospiraceae bacterium]